VPQMNTASQLYSHLACSHRVHMDAFAEPSLRDNVSPFIQMLWERGRAYEQEVIRGLGLPFLDLSGLKGDEKEAASREAIARQEPLIYSGRLSVEELLGEPDLLRFENGGYVAIDIKSGAGEEGGSDEDEEDGKPKKTYGVQIALYTDILIRLGVSAGRYGYIWDVHGQEKRYDLDTKLGPKSPCLWEIYLVARAEVTRILTGADSRAAACSVCKLCVWKTACHRVLRESRDLTLLPELGRAKREALWTQFPALEDLAAANVERFCNKDKTDFKGIGAKTLRKFHARAALAVASNPVPYLTRPIVWPAVEVELFFDIETDPMRDICYLHGFVIRERGDVATERFVAVYADGVTPEAERAAFLAAMGVFRAYPNAAVVHYSKYERTEYRKLQTKYPDISSVQEIEALYSTPRAFDLLYDATRPASEWPTMDYSIKTLAQWCGFNWRDSDPSGAASIQWFDQWVRTQDPAIKQRLLDYNEDDCVAMRIVMDAMKGFEVRA
jgi:predicted RecB family nuclease